MRNGPRRQAGFNIVELIITLCILAVLSSVAIAKMRDYTRRARISEALLASGQCKTMVSESYPVLDSEPPAGRWGCEGNGTTNYVGAIQTSSNGVIRVTIRNLDNAVNGHHVFLVPAKPDGVTPMRTPDNLGDSVRTWICGSDWLPVLNSLPSNCRTDTTTYASQSYS